MRRTTAFLSFSLSKNNFHFSELRPRHFTLRQPCSHPESGHLAKNLSLGFPAQVPTLLFLGHLSKWLKELNQWKVSDLSPNHLISNRCLLPCSLAPGTEGQRTALPPAHWATSNHSHPFPPYTHTHVSGICNKSCDFTSLVWVQWNCTLNQKNPGVFTSLKRKLGS